MCGCGRYKKISWKKPPDFADEVYVEDRVVSRNLGEFDPRPDPETEEDEPEEAEEEVAYKVDMEALRGELAGAVQTEDYEEAARLKACTHTLLWCHS